MSIDNYRARMKFPHMLRTADMRFHITGSGNPRPAAGRVIFCDGGVDDTYRRELDIELSHWIPNRTPREFKADTSTEICIKFIVAGRADDYDLAINNHVDVDGVLSVFVLLFQDTALKHRDTIIQAAEMGDFWSWGEPPAQRLFQTLTCLIDRLRQERADTQAIYSQCFERTFAVLDGTEFSECADGLAALRHSVRLIESGAVARTVLSSRFVHYAIPSTLAASSLDAALHVPRFNAPLSEQAMLPPQARAKFDAERVQLVSIATQNGHYFDLWYPGYVWADVVQRWRPPGIVSTGSSNSHYLDLPALTAATVELNKMDASEGQWTLARTLSPFATLAGRNFSVVLSHTSDGRPAASALQPDSVATRLAAVFGSIPD